MATDKPLPDSDDDIIDLTDLVEAGTAGDGASGDNGVDMSFEQELDDLFGDAEPMPAKSATAAKAAPPADADDDLFDLTGFEVADAGKPAADADDDVMDLSGFGLDEADESAPAGSLADLGFDDDAGAPQPAAASAQAAAADDDALDISDMRFDDPGDAAPQTKDAPGSLDALDSGDLEDSAAAPLPADEALHFDDLDFDAVQPDSPDTVADVAAALTDQDDDTGQAVSDADLDALLAEPDEAASDAAMAEMLGTLPDSPDTPDITDVIDFTDVVDIPEGLDVLESTADAMGETAQAEQTDFPAAAVAAAIPLAAMAATATARSDAGPSVGGIDLGALDTLIDSSKGTQAESETQADAAADKALAARLDALEAATDALAERLDGLPEFPGEDTLAQALAARLENALAIRLEAMLASRPAAAAPEIDLGGLKASLLNDVQATLAAHLDALRQELPAAGDPARQDDMARVLDSMRESLTRLEALSQGRHTQFQDFAQTVETRLAELRRELPDPEDFVSAKRLTEALDGLRQTLGDDLAGSFDARLEAVAEAARETARTEVQSLGEALAGRLEALENDRIDPDALAETLRESLAEDLARSFDPHLETVAEAARTEVQRLGVALAGRLDALENDRIDPDALAAKLRETLLSDALDPQALQDAADTAARAEAAAQKALADLDTRLTPGDLDAAINTLRADMRAEMERTVPQAAATVIREEIAALLKDFSE
ncbi:hypothetical protein [Solidesulfovibrio sp.]